VTFLNLDVVRLGDFTDYLPHMQFYSTTETAGRSDEHAAAVLSPAEFLGLPSLPPVVALPVLLGQAHGWVRARLGEMRSTFRNIVV
jgi:hypothetical protein